jgi:hypothetical protein
MTEPPPHKKQKKKGPLRAGDPFLTAEAFTHKKVTTVNSSGHKITQEVKVPLILQKDKQENKPVYVQEEQTDGPSNSHYEEILYEEPVRPTGTRRV